MTYSSRRFLVVLLLGIFLQPNHAIGADDLSEQHPDEKVVEPWVNEVPCQGKETEGTGFIKGIEFRVCLVFKATELQPKTGATNWATVYFDSYTKRTNKNLTSVALRVDHEADHPGLITEDAIPVGLSRDYGQSASVQRFTTKIGVRSNAGSDNYPLSLSLKSVDDIADLRIEFRLPVLNTGTDSISLKQINRSEVDCWAGSKCSPLQLHFENPHPFKLTITKVVVNSDDLLEPNPTLNDNSVDASSGKEIMVDLKAKPMTFSRVFSGFGKPQLTMNVEYNDEQGRVLRSKADFGFQIRPNILVLTIILVLGAVVGTIVRIDLGRLQKAGVISRRERLVFALTTFASGILVCLIALFANIKLVVLNDQNSYSAWDPKVLFFTALIATVSGLPILYAYLKIPRQGADTGKKEAADPKTD